MTGRLRVAFHGGLATLFAASALSSVFDGLGWLPAVFGGIFVVVAVSELVRWSPVPSGLSPLVAAAGVLCYVTWVYAPDEAIASFIPNGASMQALADVARSGFDDVRDLATPVPTHDGLVLLAVVGLAAIALLVDLFAVTMRRAAVAGLPLLAVFALCTSVAKHGASWITFVIGTTGYLWLLLADSRERVSRWGSPLGYDRESRPRFNWSDSEVAPSPLSVMGRRIGVSAIAIAVVVPMAIPGLRGGVSRTGSGFGFGSGSSTAVTVNPIVSIRASLHSGTARPVMFVNTTDQAPGYLRMTSLDAFNGQTFSPTSLQAPASAQVSNGLAAPVTEGSTQNTLITVQDLAVHWLPLPTQAVDVQIDGDWRYEPASNTVFSARSDTQDVVYRVQSVKPDPSPAALRRSVAIDSTVSSYLQLPDISPDVQSLAARVTAGATTPFDKALAIQRYFNSAPFVYDLDVEDTGSDTPLEDFLFRTHRGFCQQYATAMAVLARAADIPARIAVGFTRGVQQADGRWLVTTRDAHAWPELYFTGYGWLPFEPTPRGDGQAVPPDYTIAAAPGPTTDNKGDGKGGNGANAKRKPTVSKNDRLDQLADGAFAPSNDTGAAPAGNGQSRRALVGWTLLALLLVALITPAVARAVTRRRRWRNAVTPAERATAAWDELRASAIDARAGWIDGLTPRATARVLRAEALGLATAEVRALDRVVEAVQQAWYAADHTPHRADSLEDDVDALRLAFMSEATFAERLALRLWPRSTLRSARSVTGRFATMLDMVDLGLARLRARLRPRTTG